MFNFRRKPKKLKNGKSLKSQLRYGMIAYVTLLVLTYSIGMMFYFITGLNFANKIELKEYAREYNEKVGISSNENPPIRTLIVSKDYNELPERIRKEFPQGSFELGIPKKGNADTNAGDNKYMSFLLAEKANDGSTVYFIRELIKFPRNMAQDIVDFGVLEKTLLIGAASAILLVVLLVFFFTRRLSRRITALQQWTDTLHETGQDIRPPDFNYAELNTIANHLANATHRIGEFVAREHAFLRHASHELRTPITIVSGNTSLLEKLSTTDKQREVVGRIMRASHSMETIVSTLLWLGRENEPNPEKEAVDLAELIQHIIDDHTYLLPGKHIDLETDLQPVVISASRVPLSIILANIIRNAFQHTQSGRIEVRLDKNEITVSNWEAPQGAEFEMTTFDESQGIGLSLVRRIAQRLNWDFRLDATNSMVRTRLIIPDQDPNIEIKTNKIK